MWLAEGGNVGLVFLYGAEILGGTNEVRAPSFVYSGNGGRQTKVATFAGREDTKAPGSSIIGCIHGYRNGNGWYVQICEHTVKLGLRTDIKIVIVIGSRS
ncbi:hypothetical protein N8T08_003094 [Aspergillus melleus]|uniref:Uncharacterized protein n=1 Tax=Aspergillus melleus TaxID=138277 RepID=A0ACC3B7H2_9EURO|nr:hypothetical protein N8T08_003094 [Aspergillus melleus]